MSVSTVTAVPAATTATRRRSFADLGVNVKILMATGCAAAVAVVVGLIGLRALAETSHAAQHIYSSNVTNIAAIGGVRAALLKTRLDVSAQAIAGDAAATAKYAQAYRDDVTQFDAALRAYRGSHPAGDPSDIDALQTDWQAYQQVVETKLFPAGERNDFSGWERIRDAEVLPIMTEVNATLDTLGTAEARDAAGDAATAKSGYESSRTTAILLLVLGLLLAVGLGVLIARGIVRSLGKVEDVCDGLAAGDLTRTSGLTSGDETGRMGRALDTALAGLRRTVATIDGSAASLAGASERMSGTARQIAASAELTTAQARAVSTAADDVSRSVETVSAGSEQMGAAIREISQNASEAARVASEAVTVTAATATTMSKLGESSAEIGNVINTITAIAEQTNLLALNATIEAARAGEAGKGFAVVASEVKDLAQETARATEDISRRVQAIQADTTGAVTAIENVSQVIARISDFQTTIASAVEEQTATTAEMNRNVAEAAGGTGQIADTITDVAQAAQVTSQGVTDTQQATGELARMSTELTTLVAKFRY